MREKKFLSKANLFVEILTKDARFDAFVGERDQVLASFDSWNALRRPAGSLYVRNDFARLRGCSQSDVVARSPPVSTACSVIASAAEC